MLGDWNVNYAPTSSLLDQQKTSVNNLHYFCKTLVTCLLMCGKFSPAREEYKSSSDTELKRSASSELDCRSMSSSSTSLDPLFKLQVKGAEIMCISLSSVLKSSNSLKTHYAGLLTWTSTSWGDQLMVWLLSLLTCKWEWCSQIGLKETATFLWNLFMKLYISCANWPCLAVWYLVHSLVQSYK